MNIFVAGVHGVGKTYLASQIKPDFGLIHTSASKLIKEELSLPDWDTDKKVTNVDVNQIALAVAVKRYNSVGKQLLLDGHFVLLDQAGNFSPLGVDVFRSLNLEAVILLEDDPQIIANRVKGRDNLNQRSDYLAEFLMAERSQGEAVCRELNIPLQVLRSTTTDRFIEAVRSVIESTRH